MNITCSYQKIIIKISTKQQFIIIICNPIFIINLFNPLRNNSILLILIFFSIWLHFIIFSFFLIIIIIIVICIIIIAYCYQILFFNILFFVKIIKIIIISNGSCNIKLSYIRISLVNFFNSALI
jgi:hypothetical protein